jgi:hypothetical protein
MVKLAQFFGRLIPIQWDAVLALQGTGVRFVAILVGNDPISQSFESILTAFLTSHGIHTLIVKVEVYEQAAQQLGVSYLPQIRLYEKGQEVHRHRGSADYEALKRILL